MSSLTGNLISSTYQGMLKTLYNTPFSESVVRITDGLGNLSALGLSTGSAIVYGNTQISGSLEIISQDTANNSLYTEGGIVAGRSGWYNSGSGGYTQVIHTDTSTGGLSVVRPTTTDNVYRNFNTNAFYITTVAPINSGSIYIQPSGLDKLVIRASVAVSGSRAVPVQVTGSINTTGTVTTTGLNLTGSVAIQGTGSIKLAGQLSFDNGQGALVLPANTAPVPAVGSTYYNGSTLYVYNGSTYTQIGGDTVVSASYATTASYVNPLQQNVQITGSLAVSSSILVNNITVGRGSGNISSNTALGNAALANNITGYMNTAIGANTLYYNTTGNQNTAIGYQSLWRNTTGYLNIGIGLNALANNVSGSYNIALGISALNANSSEIGNLAIGPVALENNSGDYNVALGSSALNAITTGTKNTAVGVDAGKYITAGNYNTLLGGWQGTAVAQSNNIIISDGAQNVKFWYNSGSNGVIQLLDDTQITGSLGITGSLSTNKNITMNYLTIGEGNTPNVGTIAFGVNALALNTGYNNVALGSSALTVNTSGTGNTAVGAIALQYNTNGASNTAVGLGALQFNTTGQLNVAIGDSALQNNVSGSANTAVGPGALNDLLGNTSSDIQNSAFGSNALSGLTAGQFNTAVGYNAGGYITSGNYNTILGFWSGSSTTMNNNVVLADGANNIAYRYDGSHYLMPQGLSNYANDAAAAAGGIPVNGMYRSGSVVMIRVS